MRIRVRSAPTGRNSSASPPPEPATLPEPAATVPVPADPGSTASAADLIGFNPRAQTVIIALLAGILMLLCVEVYLLIALHPIANGDDRQAQRTGVSQTIR